MSDFYFLDGKVLVHQISEVQCSPFKRYDRALVFRVRGMLPAICIYFFGGPVSCVMPWSPGSFFSDMPTKHAS